MNWLAGSKNISKTYEYKMKSTIRKKLDTLFNTELPLIQNSGLFPRNLTAFGKNLTAFGKNLTASSMVHNSITGSDIKNIAQSRSLGRDLDPGPLPYQGNALPG